jgi:hypothetical protein
MRHAPGTHVVVCGGAGKTVSVELEGLFQGAVALVSCCHFCIRHGQPRDGPGDSSRLACGASPTLGSNGLVEFAFT